MSPRPPDPAAARPCIAAPVESGSEGCEGPNPKPPSSFCRPQPVRRTCNPAPGAGAQREHRIGGQVDLSLPGAVGRLPAAQSARRSRPRTGPSRSPPLPAQGSRARARSASGSGARSPPDSRPGCARGGRRRAGSARRLEAQHRPARHLHARAGAGRRRVAAVGLACPLEPGPCGPCCPPGRHRAGRSQSPARAPPRRDRQGAGRVPAELQARPIAPIIATSARPAAKAIASSPMRGRR